MKVGDRVRVVDYSDAHGDIGVIDTIQSNGIILVTLTNVDGEDTDEGVIWPVSSEAEIQLLED